ncbi:transporter [Escherichia coli]|nr:transporter [Escherichia coli]EFD7753645.1 transporter [Escherichia coli]EFH9021817.1 transporter [Escherichia coli]
MSFQTCHLPVTDDVVVPATATVLLFSAALITVCFVVLLLMPFPGVPLAGRAVVNGASGAVSALAGFHP